MDWGEILAIVECALTRLVKAQPALLDLNVTERSLTHYLALYIAERVPGYDVDVEYNRHGDIPKRLNLPRRKVGDRCLKATTVFPDILIHKRNTDCNNILALEVKKPGEKLEYDEAKLCAFLTQLHYQYAAHVIIGRQNGKIVRKVIRVCSGTSETP